MEKALYDTYLAILKEELVPAMGCTEPIAVAMLLPWLPGHWAARQSRLR